MTVALGKVISSASHLLYHVRVYDTSERESPPQIVDYTFGRFVAVHSTAVLGLSEASSPEQHEVGVIADTQLIHPDSGHYGPRLTVPHAENRVFAPDYINEVGVRLTILLLGSWQQGWGSQHIPGQVMPVGTEVSTLSVEKIREFHHNERQQFQMRYYPWVWESGLAFASALLLRMLEQIESLCSASEQRMIEVLRKHTVRQSTGYQR